MNEENEELLPEETAAPAPAPRKKQKPRRMLSLGTCIFVTLCCVMLTVTIMLLLLSSTLQKALGKDSLGTVLAQAANVIRSDFVGDVDTETLQSRAIDGMLAATGDTWSYYVPVSELQSFQDNRNNSYVGIGVTIREKDGKIMVVKVLPGSSAQEAGVVQGDELISVEGTSVAGMSTEDLRNLVVGPAGTTVTVGFRHADGSEEDFTMERRVTAEIIAEGRMVGSVGVIVLENFNTGAASALIRETERLLSEGATALVIDVRFNPGGFLTELMDCLDYFLPAGIRFISRDAQGEETVERTDQDGACLTVPLAVLVNDNTYSAAEYFAAALQEYGRATVVGVQTPGKGRAQTPHYLADGSCIVLSTIEYVTPNGVSLAEGGITPDAVVTPSREEYYAVAYADASDQEDSQLQKALELVK